MSLNKVMLIGRLGKDPEVRYTQSGKAVCNFSVATSERWKDSAGVKQEKTEWHNVVAWGKIVDVIQQYVKKGQEIYIEGKLQTTTWDEKDGNKRYKTEVVMDTMSFIGNNGGQGMAAEANQPRTAAPESDLPF